MRRPLAEPLPESWRSLLRESVEKLFPDLSSFLEEEYGKGQVFPPYEEIFSAFALTPPEKVKVLLLGQDPYHDENQAHGLAFSVRDGVKKPASLRNIIKEYTADTGFPAPESGSLVPWAKEGVLLLNTVLTVRAHEADSHKGHTWELFTDSVISAVNAFPRHIVFLLWGNPAGKKLPLIDQTRHTVLCSAHPSPLSAHRGFFGSHPFSRCNEALARHGQEKVNWDLSQKETPGKEEQNL